jgi:hypothetical protein
MKKIIRGNCPVQEYNQKFCLCGQFIYISVLLKNLVLNKKISSLDAIVLRKCTKWLLIFCIVINNLLSSSCNDFIIIVIIIKLIKHQF